MRAETSPPAAGFRTAAGSRGSVGLRTAVARIAAGRTGVTRVSAICAGLALASSALAPPAALAQDLENGREVYDRWCAECHGAEGAGDGPAADYMLPRPRDFVQARYQVRTTGPGELPTDEDIMHILEVGMPGTAMPAWPNLTESEKRDVTAYIKSFSRFFENADPQPMDFAADPGGGEEALASGREVYRELECWKCHGESGRGSGQSTPTLEDWRDVPIRAADLTEPWNFNGGAGAEAVYRRMMTGLDGTPMPAYSDAVASDVVTTDEMWHLAHYVESLAPTPEPRTSDLISAARIEGELPSSPDDGAWDEARAAFVPLVGQVIETPRAFAPTVDGVWVRALHDGERVALRLEWGDPSNSPDTTWNEWQARIVESLHADEAELSPDEPMTDGLAVQFPAEMPEGAERPYFLMGESNDPVTLWTWDSRAGAVEAQGRGLGSISSLSGGDLSAESVWDGGHWEVVLARSLAGGVEGAISLAEGVVTPVAFFAWDGSSAETPERGSVSSWIYLYLEEPTSSNVVIAPIVALLLTGGLLWWLVRGAQRRSARSGSVPAGDPATEGA
ncbi:MAG: c-type cytochrome [Gemmatimonadota bacterium]